LRRSERGLNLPQDWHHRHYGWDFRRGSAIFLGLPIWARGLPETSRRQPNCARTAGVKEALP
jgi:hypothetical protein